MAMTFTRSWMDEDLNQWRDTCARFVEEELVADDEAARQRGNVGRGLWTRAGSLGLLWAVRLASAGAPPTPASHGGYGLIAMRERVAQLAGELRFEPGPQGGAQVALSLPVHGEVGL